MASRYLVAEIPLGIDGLNGSKNVSNIPPTALITAENITFENGTIQKEGGSSLFTATSLATGVSVLGGHDWNHDGNTQRSIIAMSDGTLRKDTGGGGYTVTLATGLTMTNVVPTFVEAGKEAAANNRKLFIFTESNAVQVLSADGATTAAITTPPSDWSGTSQPIFGINHESRLWGGGNSNQPHTLYYSTASDHENMGGGTVDVYPGEGHGLLGGVSFKGGIVVFKYPRGIYFVDTTDPTSSNWKVKKISDRIGTVGPRTFETVENDIAFLDQGGDIRLLSAVQEFGDLGTRSLSDTSVMGPFIRNELDLSTARNWHMVYHATKRQLHLACTKSGSSANDARLIMDFNTPQKVKFHFSTKDTNISLWTRLGSDNVPELLSGDNNGQVWLLDQTNRNKNSAGYTGKFQTPHVDFSYIEPDLSTKRKNGRFLELVTEPKGNWNLDCEIYWDGNLSGTVSFNLGSAGAALGSFVLGTDQLGGDSVLNKKRRITGSGRRLSILGKNSGVDQDFSAARLFLHFTVGNERL